MDILSNPSVPSLSPITLPSAEETQAHGQYQPFPASISPLTFLPLQVHVVPSIDQFFSSSKGTQNLLLTGHSQFRWFHTMLQQELCSSRGRHESGEEGDSATLTCTSFLPIPDSLAFSST